MPAAASPLIDASPPTSIEDGLDAQLRPFPCESGPAWEAAWRDLEQRSLHRNPFLSPSFLFPQWQSMEHPPSAQLLTIIDREGRWLLAGLFERVRGTCQLPLPHLRAVRTEHTFMTGLLVDTAKRELAIDTLWRFLRQQRLHGLSFPMFPVQSRLSQLLTERCEKDPTAVTWDDVHLRAKANVSQTASSMSPKRAKSLRRGRRALEKRGQVSFRFAECREGDLSAVERFLFLESLGWKGKSQSALACRPGEVRALKEVARGFAAEDRIRFAELLIDERVIASMCLFRSETDYYAFKIGWEPQFERGCPGFLLAAEIQDHLSELPQCERIDSCSSPGSFLDHVWSGQKEVGTAMFTVTRWGSIAVTGTRLARNLYRKWSDPARESRHAVSTGCQDPVGVEEPS